MSEIESESQIKEGPKVVDLSNFLKQITPRLFYWSDRVVKATDIGSDQRVVAKQDCFLSQRKLSDSIKYCIASWATFNDQVKCCQFVFHVEFICEKVSLGLLNEFNYALVETFLVVLGDSSEEFDSVRSSGIKVSSFDENFKKLVSLVLVLDIVRFWLVKGYLKFWCWAESCWWWTASCCFGKKACNRSNRPALWNISVRKTRSC